MGRNSKHSAKVALLNVENKYYSYTSDAWPPILWTNIPIAVHTHLFLAIKLMRQENDRFMLLIIQIEWFCTSKLLCHDAWKWSFPLAPFTEVREEAQPESSPLELAQSLCLAQGLVKGHMGMTSARPAELCSLLTISRFSVFLLITRTPLVFVSQQ